MNGVNRASTANVDKVGDLNWHIMGAADFNNDGKSDIIWRNYANGQNLVWLMNGSTHTGDLDILDEPNRNFTIVGKSDPVGIWTTDYFGNKDLSGTPTSSEGFTDITGNFSRNWGLGAPANTSADNFSARYKTEKYLPAGLYKINVGADDSVRVWIGNELVIDGWANLASNRSGYFSSPGGYSPVTIEYKEEGGAASLNYEIVKYQPYDTFGDGVGLINSWNATFFQWNGQGTPIMDDAHKIGTVKLTGNTRGDGQWGMDLQNWGAGSPAPGVPVDNFAMHAYTRAGLTAGHTYEVWVRSDDGYQVFAHKLGGGPFNITPNALNGEWQPGAYGNAVKWIFVAPESGTFDFKINMFEGGGNAYVELVLKDVTAPPPPTGDVIFNNFINSYVGGRTDIDGFPNGYIYQCTDWAARFVADFAGLGLPNTMQVSGGAKDWFEDFGRSGAKMFWNPQRIYNQVDNYPDAGDIVVWNSNFGQGYGHVTVADFGSTLSSLNVIEQNGVGNGQGTGADAIRRKNYGYGSVLGWIRIPAIHQKIYGY